MQDTTPWFEQSCFGYCVRIRCTKQCPRRIPDFLWQLCCFAVISFSGVFPGWLLLVNVEVSNLADFPLVAAKNYYCIFKISPITVVRVAAVRDDRIFSCIQPSLPAGTGELQIFVDQMQVGPGVVYSVLNTIQLIKVKPRQIFAKASENVELVTCF